MEGIKISTTQNIDFEYVPAGAGYRVLATLLDGIFTVAYVVLIFLVYGMMNRSLNYNRNSYLEMSIIILLLLPALLYHFLCETFMNGQSFGKKIVGTRVVKLDGTQPGISSYMLRSLLRIIDISLLNGLVALISVIASEKSQRLGDMAAGTTVIKMGTKLSLKDTILFRQQSDYKIVFPQVELLSDKDAATIKEVLDFAMANGKPEALTLLAQKVKTKLSVSSDLTDDLFLKTVLLDYSHFQFER
ncbi:MAG: RDD family protein [Bacteroidia bacterium]